MRCGTGENLIFSLLENKISSQHYYSSIYCILRWQKHFYKADDYAIPVRYSDPLLVITPSHWFWLHLTHRTLNLNMCISNNHITACTEGRVHATPSFVLAISAWKRNQKWNQEQKKLTFHCHWVAAKKLLKNQWASSAGCMTDWHLIGSCGGIHQ